MRILALFSSAIFATAPAHTLNAQFAPSQLELNGFLIGQHRSAIVAELGKPYQEQRTPDGWTYQVFVIDQPRGVYMVVKYDDVRPNHAIALQLTGDSSKKVLPFVGVRLGDDTTAALRVFGPPTSRRAIASPQLTLWTYQDRNFSIEFTPSGRLYSISILGYVGFPQIPTGDLPIAALRSALSASSALALMPLLAPDAEVYRGDSVHTFGRSVRRELADSSSRMAQELLFGERSLRSALADSAAWIGTDEVLRLHERPRAGAIYRVVKFKDESPVRELVFEGIAGEWRLWEIAWR